MTGPELGFLMLASHLSDGSREILSVSQLRRLATAMRNAQGRGEDRPLEETDLIRCGFDLLFSQRILRLLQDEALLEDYLLKANESDCFPLTWASPNYPAEVRRHLRDEAPGCLWAKGDIGLLEQPKISVVGSRKPGIDNARFAYEVGRQAAMQGFVLVSGNAKGVDQMAQQGALDAGGCVISVVADRLCDRPGQDRVLYLSEEDFDADFSSRRALSRNRVIHSLGRCTFVAQSSLHTGGTWSGTCQNLRNGWSDVFVYQDGSPASAELVGHGAKPCSFRDLSDIRALILPDKQ